MKIFNCVDQEKNSKLDCKTRWYLLVPMIEILIKLKKYIKLALADLGKNDLYSEEMFIVLEEILKILKHTELAVKELNKDEATLLTSEVVFLFLFIKLLDQNTDLSNEMLDALKKRFVERRNKDLVSLMRYLQNPTLPREMMK
jgi:hypothetical protein